MNVTFVLQKSISMWYNNYCYSMQVDKNSINKGMYSFWDIACDKVKNKIKKVEVGNESNNML